MKRFGPTNLIPVLLAIVFGTASMAFSQEPPANPAAKPIPAPPQTKPAVQPTDTSAIVQKPNYTADNKSLAASLFDAALTPSPLILAGPAGQEAKLKPHPVALSAVIRSPKEEETLLKFLKDGTKPTALVETPGGKVYLVERSTLLPPEKLKELLKNAATKDVALPLFYAAYLSEPPADPRIVLFDGAVLIKPTDEKFTLAKASPLSLWAEKNNYTLAAVAVKELAGWFQITPTEKSTPTHPMTISRDVAKVEGVKQAEAVVITLEAIEEKPEKPANKDPGLTPDPNPSKPPKPSSPPNMDPTKTDPKTPDKPDQVMPPIKEPPPVKPAVQTPPKNVPKPPEKPGV